MRRFDCLILDAGLVLENTQGREIVLDLLKGRECSLKDRPESALPEVSRVHSKISWSAEAATAAADAIGPTN